MDEWWAAFTAIGGLAAVGGLIDLALYKSEKEKLKARLEDWWLRFTDVKWSNFGRAEAELAVQILDRWAGPRLWTWKRWRFSMIVTLTVTVLVVLWVLVRATWSGDHIDISNEGATTYVAVGLFLLFIVGAGVAFALSLSVTRYIAMVAAKLCRGAFFNSLLFALLLVLHLILFLFWSSIVLALELIPIAVVVGLLDFFGVKPSGIVDFRLILDNSFSQLGMPAWLPHSSLTTYSENYGAVEDLTYRASKFAMDIVANGLRILFALVFLSSFVFRPLIQGPISRLWYGAMNSGKPIFTMLFGAVGTMIAVAQILTK